MVGGVGLTGEIGRDIFVDDELDELCRSCEIFAGTDGGVFAVTGKVFAVTGGVFEVQGAIFAMTGAGALTGELVQTSLLAFVLG